MSTSRIRFQHPFLRFLASLHLAVVVLLSLAGVLAVATVLESSYGMRAAHVLVYGTYWFAGLLALLATNVLFAALSRYPWKRHQTGFVITHAGILTILAGSFLTQQFGVDGSLPVQEGSVDGSVILNDLRLTVIDEGAGKQMQMALPESAFVREGRLVDVDLGDQRRLVADRFLPRIHAPRGLKADPSGLGPPGLYFELFNERFQVAEWIQVVHPSEPTELPMGPAIVSLQTLSTAQAEQDWRRGISTNVPPLAKSKRGQVEIVYRGRQFAFDIADAGADWRPLGTTGLEMRIDRFLPFAIVEKGKLISRSEKPINPAVQLTVRDLAGTLEQHTLFARFPEFATRHGGVKADRFGLHLAMRHPAFADAGGPGSGPRGRLEFARSADGQNLLYRVFRRREFLMAGVVKPKEEVGTGWMDLRFRVVQYFPHAIQEDMPLYIETLPPGESNFASAIRFHTESAGEASPPFWLMEGEARNLAVGSRSLVVRFGKETQDLPFKLKLEKFTIGHDPGSARAASYSSQVRVESDDPNKARRDLTTIQMNEPLHHGGYTFYQASYQMQEGAPPLSVFSVNSDPGRWVKYFGSLVMVFGIALMFYMNPHYWDKVFSAGRKKKS